MNRNPALGRFAFACAIALVFALPAGAHDNDDEPIKYGDDARYLSVQYVKYKTGRREEAMQIITEYFGPAAMKAELTGPMLAIHFQTGEWDAAFIWPLESGMADLEWYRSPDSIKWFEALAVLNGGTAEADKIVERYQDTVRERDTWTLM